MSDPDKIKIAVHQRIELNNKLEYSNLYEYRKKWKKITRNWKLSEEEKKAIENPEYLGIRRNVKLML